MVLVLGVNAGFVEVAPTANPSESNVFHVDGTAIATQDVVPSTAARVIEIGFWVDNSASNGQNWEVGIYQDSGADTPSNAISLNQTNTLSSGIGWKRVTGLNIDISSYQDAPLFIAVQVDSNDFINTDSSSPGQSNTMVNTSSTTLEDPFPSAIASTRIYGIYAVVAEASGLNAKINISDIWKDVDAMKINIGDSWKDVVAIKQNIGNVWKDV